LGESTILLAWSRYERVSSLRLLSPLLIASNASNIMSHRLGLTLARLPDTFYLHVPIDLQTKIPQFVGDIRLIHSLQCGVMLFSYVAALSLTQKLCDDNKIGVVRFGAHALVQTIGTFLTLYLLLSPEASISAYR